MQKPQSARVVYFFGGLEPGGGLGRHSSNEPKGGAMGSQSGFEGDRLTAGARLDLPPNLREALEWLKLRLDKPIVLDDLAAAAGVRPRTLEAQFRLHLGTTPMGWVRKTRLARARQQLLASREEANVTDIALANGFTELGRFSARYRQAFGELPSETLKASRRAAPDDDIDDEAVRLSWSALAAAFTVAPGQNRAALDDVERAQELAPHSTLCQKPLPPGAGASAPRTVSARRHLRTVRTRSSLLTKRRVSRHVTRLSSVSAAVR
jgi:AraC-like DNA-binding protein